MSIQKETKQPLIDASQFCLDVSWELPRVPSDLGIYIDAQDRLMTTVRSARSPIQHVLVTTTGTVH